MKNYELAAHKIFFEGEEWEEHTESFFSPGEVEDAVAYPPIKVIVYGASTETPPASGDKTPKNPSTIVTSTTGTNVYIGIGDQKVKLCGKLYSISGENPRLAQVYDYFDSSHSGTSKQFSQIYRTTSKPSTLYATIEDGIWTMPTPSVTKPDPTVIPMCTWFTFKASDTPLANLNEWEAVLARDTIKVKLPSNITDIQGLATYLVGTGATYEMLYLKESPSWSYSGTQTIPALPKGDSTVTLYSGSSAEAATAIGNYMEITYRKAVT